MKYYQSILYTAVMLIALSGCSSEDDLQPSNKDKNYFAPDESATDAESILRRNFYKRDSCYVLFNDTLRHEELGTNANGVMQYLTETVDVPYVMTAASQYAYKYSYLTTISEKQGAVTFVDEYLMPHLGTKLRPFSWLLVNHITMYSVSDGIYTYNSDPQYAVGNRATAIALETLSSATNEEKAALGQTILAGIVANRVTAQTATTLNSFTKYCSSLYGGYSTEYATTEDENLVIMEKGGFITGHYYDIWLLWGSYPTQAEDISSFAKLVLTKTESEVNEMYASYPTIIAKYKVMKSIIQGLGYVF
jgi:hypothetical protein